MSKERGEEQRAHGSSNKAEGFNAYRLLPSMELHLRNGHETAQKRRQPLEKKARPFKRADSMQCSPPFFSRLGLAIV
jgi:hypothetical protein